MSAKILAFPGLPPQLDLEGFVLIAWRLTVDGDVFPDLGNHYGCLWKPASGKGWYEAGHHFPPCPGDLTGHLVHGRMSRANAIESWRDTRWKPQYSWHYLVSEAEAFGEEKRRGMRPPRVLTYATMR